MGSRKTGAKRSSPCRTLGCLVALILVLASMAVYNALHAVATAVGGDMEVWWWVQTSLESGEQRDDEGDFVDVWNNAKDRLIMRACHLLEFLGYLYSPFLRSMPLQLLYLEATPPASFCRRVLDYKWLAVEEGGMEFPQVRANLDDMRLFVQYCQQEWHNLGSEEAELLSAYRAEGDIPESVVRRPPTAKENLFHEALKEADQAYDVGRVLGADEISRLINISTDASLWNVAKPGEAFRRTDLLSATDVESATAKMVEYYQSLNIRDLPTIASTWKAVGEAIKKGEMAVFDAKPLMPRELINATFQQLADMEGPGAKTTSVLSNGCKPRTLRNYAEVHAAEDQGRRSQFTLANYGVIAGEPDIGWDKHNMIRQRYEQNTGPQCKVGYVNNRRMKNFYSRLPDLPRELGMEDEILRDEGYLWMGPVRGGFHYDEEANIYIQLTGETDTFLIPQSHVNLFTRGGRFRNLPTREEIAQDPVLKKIPFHLFRLKPGDGVVFPGRTFHLFCAQTWDRLAVNFFFVPKWRKMEYTKHDWYTQEAAEPLGPERLALRQLWARTFVRLYEETGRGVIYMGQKNEYI